MISVPQYEYDENDPYDRRRSQYVMKNQLDEIERVRPVSIIFVLAFPRSNEQTGILLLYWTTLPHPCPWGFILFTNSLQFTSVSFKSISAHINSFLTSYFVHICVQLKTRPWPSSLQEFSKLTSKKTNHNRTLTT